MLARTARKFTATLLAALLVAACSGSGHTPTPLRYTVAGTVTGLRGTGLVLLDNRGGTLALSADGGFSMPDTWLAGESYSVSVQTQPSGPAQTCTVAGGSGGVSGNVTSVMVTCPAPAAVAAFSAPASVVANTVAAFDGSASTASDGSALTYFWDFGDGSHGGGPKIAHLFATAGSKPVTLTVTDGSGVSASQTNTVTVTAGAAPTSTATVAVSVTGLDGVALPGVTVSVVGGGASGTSDATGTASLTVGLGVPAVLKFQKSGYADQFLPVQMPSTAGADAAVSAVMRTRDAALTLADAAAGGTVTGRDGAVLTLPPNALVDSTGAAVTGPVQLTLTPVDPTRPGGGGFPGAFSGVQTDGTATPIVSYGTVEYTLSSGGQLLHLAPGKTATIALPIYATTNLDGTAVAVGDTTPLWSLDEASGNWIQEGRGVVVASAGSPSGLALQAVVTHFSWWNCDAGYVPYIPDPQCVEQTGVGIPGSVDTFANATICNMLAEMDPTMTVLAASGTQQIRSLPAATPNPVLPGFSLRFVVPIAGGVGVPSPPNRSIRLTAAAVNGTWVGSAVTSGAAGVETPVLVPMHPLASAGPGTTALTLPADTTLTLQTGQAPTFTFTGQAHAFAQVTVSQPQGSTLTGNVTVSQGTATLGTAAFGTSAGVITIPLEGNVTYQIAIAGTSGVPGAFRLQVQLLGGTPQTASLQLPFDTQVATPAYTDYVGSLASTGGQSVLFGIQRIADPTSGAFFERVDAPDGSSPLRLDVADLQNAAVLGTATLTTAGNYAVELRDTAGRPAQYRITGEATQWRSIAPPLPVTSGFNLGNLLADRNGMPVVFYANSINNAGHTSNVVSLRGWTGTAWTAIGPDLTIDRPCTAGLSLAVQFDSSNAPVVVYGNTDAAQTLSFFAAQRLVNGAWTPLGAANGTLSYQSATADACRVSPAVAIGADGAALAAYPVNANVVVERFDGTAWGVVTSAANDQFPQPPGGTAGFDLEADANGRPYLVIGGVGGPGQTTVWRLSSTTPATWQTVGPNGGVLPETNTNGLSFPQLRFDANAQPTIAFVAGMGSRGTAVYRFDGTTWSTTGGYQLPQSQLSNGNVGFTLFAGESYVGWQNATYDAGFNLTEQAPIVQKSSASGYTPVGTGLGEIQQFYSHQLVTTDGFAPFLLGTNGQLYAALVGRQSNNGVSTLNIYLLQKVN
jgi:hypothetical protein